MTCCVGLGARMTFRVTLEHLLRSECNHRGNLILLCLWSTMVL